MTKTQKHNNEKYTYESYKSLNNKIPIKQIEGGGVLQNSIQGSLLDRGIHPNPKN